MVRRMVSKTKLSQRSLIIGVGGLALISILANGYLSKDEPGARQNSVESMQGAIIESDVAGDYLASKELENTSDRILPYKSQYGSLPDSLEGTLMHQSLQVDEQGNLRISSDIRRVFDYFLSTIEEEELDVILARIDEFLNHSLQEPALSQSKHVLSQYVALKQALYDFELSRSASLKEVIDSGELRANKGRYIELLQEQLVAQSDLRSEHLDPDVKEAFYASEEAFDQYSMSRLLVETQDGLSADEKAERLAQIDAQAPKEIVEARKEASITDELKSRVDQIKQSGGSQQEIRSVRVEMFGEEAAERFDELDHERAQWQTRLDSFLSQRKDILSLEGLSLEERQAQVDTLRESQFDSREQIRVKVYERKADA
jgi:lipase chaperone LimK